MFSLWVGSEGFGQGIEDVFDQRSQRAVDPGRVRDDGAVSIFVIGEINGDEEVTLRRDALPVNRQQGAAVPDLVEGAIGVVLLDQGGVTVPVGIVWMARTGVVLDQAFDEVLDGGIRGIRGRDLGQVRGGFEGDHVGCPP